MAIKHRKLFPSVNNQTNQAAECTEFCDPNCPYYCYSNPVLYLSPPPPSQPPPSPPASAWHVPPYVIIVASFLVTALLLLGFYCIISKYCTGRHRTSRTGEPTSQPGSTDEEDDEEIPMAAAAVDHPIWYIATVGLQQAIVNSITACKYKKGEGLIEGTECSVCLNEFREGETLRLLPKCNHAFHIPCIDTWLRSRTNCPLCRAPILSNDAEPNQNPSASVQIEEARAGSFGGHGDQVRTRRVSENSGRTEEDEGQRAEEDDAVNHSKQEVDPDFSSSLDESNKVRRSFSMDYARNQRPEVGKSYLGRSTFKQDHGDSSLSIEKGSSSMAEPVQENPASMKRSYSTKA